MEPQPHSYEARALLLSYFFNDINVELRSHCLEGLVIPLPLAIRERELCSHNPNSSWLP